MGGVPEVLPDDLIELAEPDVTGMSHSRFCCVAEDLADVVRAITHAIHHVGAGQHDPATTHTRVKEMYTWQDVARRTEIIYRNALLAPQADVIERWSK